MEPQNKKDYSIPVSIVAAAVVIAFAWIYTTGQRAAPPADPGAPAGVPAVQTADLASAVLPPGGVVLPVAWGDLGSRLVSLGVIDAEQFQSLYRGSVREGEAARYLSDTGDAPVRMTAENAPVLLNLFWAFGLANKNPVLTGGPMVDPRYGGAGNFASTAGWTLARGDPMAHYAAHRLVPLSPAEQALVERIAGGIYRPCCGNATHFPDCNHGMAMLGLLELMASQGVSETEMWRTALAVNSYWFPDTYLTIAAFKESQGTRWDTVDPREVLGVDFSSSRGAQRISSLVTKPTLPSGGGGCGV